MIIPILVGFVIALFIIYHTYRNQKENDKGMSQKVQESVNVFDKCHNEIFFVTDLDKDFFENEYVLNSLYSAKDRNVKIRIIFDPRVKLKESKKILKLIEKDIVQAKRAKNELTTHYWICDGIHTRLDSHEFRKFEKEKAIGRFYFNFPQLAYKLRNKFQHQWARL